MSKKRAKNSDYHYSERRDNAERMEAQRAAKKKVSRREKILYFGAFLFLMASLILWIVARKNGLTEMLSPLYGAISGVGLILLSRSYERDKPKAAKVCLVIGIIALMLSVFIFMVNQGVLNFG